MSSSNSPTNTQSPSINQQTPNSVHGATPRERRPFLWIDPVGSPETRTEGFAQGLAVLEARAIEGVQTVVRSLVNYTVTAQNRHARAAGRSAGTTLSILNRRRRAARAWILAILGGELGESTLRSITHSWIPQLAGTGPDLALAVPAGREFLEFLHGSITALVMGEPAENLVQEAKALHALETVLGVHLRALEQLADEPKEPGI